MNTQSPEEVSPKTGVEPRKRIGGRLVVLLTMVFCFGLLLLFTIFIPQHYKMWRHFGVPSLSPSFADARTITVALESDLEGEAIWQPNPRDPWERAFNYPRVWLLLKYLGINQSHTDIIGLSFAVIFFACLWRLASNLSLKEGIYFALLIFSPVTMLGVERGNTDLLIFALLTASLMLFEVRGGYRLAGSAALIMVATILKLFPFFAVSLFWSLPRRRCLILTAIYGVLFGCYLLLTASDLKLISEATPRPTYLGFGSAVILGLVLGDGLIISRLAFVLLLAGMWLLSRRPNKALLYSDGALDGGQEHSFELNSFRVGACVYLGTFFLGNNWDYRLIFLLFTLPQLLRWYRPPSLLRTAALFNLICFLLAFHWYFFSSENILRLSLIKQVINWMIAGGLSYLLLLSAPRWLKGLLMLGGDNRVSQVRDHSAT